MRTYKRSVKGFTLIEIMIVVVILGILASLVAPSVIGRSGQAKVAAARSDLSSLANALEMYYLDNNAYPTTEQGLNALKTKPTSSPEPKNWNSAGYIKKLPKDPWGNPYLYIYPGANGDFELYTLGADGKEGGTENDSDIKQWEEN